MARGRFISGAIAYDPEFNEMSLIARFLFLAALPHLDRDGLLPAHPAALWSTIAPLQPDLLAEIPQAIQEWKASGAVRGYSTRAGDVLFFVNFHKHQQGMKYDREAPSRFAAYMPPDFQSEILDIQSSIKAGTKSGLKSGVSPDSSPESCRPQGEVEVKVQVQDQLQGQGENADADANPLSAVYQCYEANMPGLLTQVITDDLADLVGTYGADNVIRAIQEAARSNGRSIRYVAKILDSWAAGKDTKRDLKPPKKHDPNNPYAYDGAELIERLFVTMNGGELPA